MTAQTEFRPVDTARLRAAYEGVRDELFAQFRAERDPDTLTKGISRAADRTLCALWERCGFGDDAALLAVGGYGRGELFPYSDVDLLLLVARPPDGELARQVECFVGACWDLGMAIGHSVRTVQECLDEQSDDITVRTALFERRSLSKANALNKALEKALAGTPEAPAFFNAKTAEMRQRHEKYANTPYSLEPNIKESPGGLRDLQTLRWVANAAGLGKTWSGLRKSGLVTSSELQMLRHNERQLRRIRAALHLTAARAEDRLIFDMQGAVAGMLGYSDRQGRRASEQLMQRYYRAAKTVTQLTTILLQNIDAQLGDQSEVTVSASKWSRIYIQNPYPEFKSRASSGGITAEPSLLQPRA